MFGHPGLHVVDGSIMPGPVGPNPSLTIAALADRVADAILEGRTAELGRAPRPRGVAPAGAAAPPASPVPAAADTPAAADGDAVAISFTEEMKGFVAFGAEDFERGREEGKRSGNHFMFHLTITADDLDRFIADRDHLARTVGYVRCEALGGERPVERGDFNLFIDNDGDERDKRMLYRLHFSDGEEHPLTMIGFKIVKDDPGVDNVWADTSTLYTRVLAGHVEAADDEAAAVVAAGILRIEPLDFAKQMTTFDAEPDGRVDAVARFGALFAGDLWEVYGPAAEGDG